MSVIIIPVVFGFDFGLAMMKNEKLR